MMRSVASPSSFLLLSFVVVFGACGTKAPLNPGASCVLNSDCTDPLSCKFGKCHRQCNETRDCAAGERCVKVDGVGVCASAAGLACATGCPSPLICGPGDQCGSVCAVEGDCLANQTCLASVCVDRTLLSDGGANGNDGGSGDGGGCSAAKVTNMFFVTCSSTGQTCTPAYTYPFDVQCRSEVSVVYTPPPGHCSDVMVDVSLDGSPGVRSSFVGANQPTAPLGLGAVAKGTHVISLQATGRIGGCNTGALASWSGQIDLAVNPL